MRLVSVVGKIKKLESLMSDISKLATALKLETSLKMETSELRWKKQVELSRVQNFPTGNFRTWHISISYLPSYWCFQLFIQCFPTSDFPNWNFPTAIKEKNVQIELQQISISFGKLWSVRFWDYLFGWFYKKYIEKKS